MSSIDFIPYEELTLLERPDLGKGSFELKTPWFQLPIAIDCKEARDTEIIVKTINKEHPLTSESAMCVDWMLKQFPRFPISYRMPRLHLLMRPDSWFPLGDWELGNDPKQLGEIILKQTESFLPVSQKQRELLLYILPTQWEWEESSVVDFAYSPLSRLYDPMTVFTIIRRFHLSHLANEDASFELYKQIGSQSPSRGDLGFYTVAQNYFITKMCDAALTPALHLDSLAKKDIEEFIHSERGHDRLLWQALLDVRPLLTQSDAPVLPSTEMTSRILFFLAKTNFLGFACALDMFERDDSLDEDLLASAMGRAGFAVAQKMLQQHKKINTQAAHEEIGISLLKNRDVGVTHREVTKTLRVLELLSRCINRISSDILDS